MAALCGCKRPTIQAVELGRLPLSGDLAGRVAVQTGVSEKWLWDNNVNTSILSSDWQPYTKEYFENFRAKQLSDGGRKEDYKLAAYTLASQVARIAGSLVAEHRTDDLRLLCYRLDKEISLITKNLLVGNKHFDSWIRDLHDDNATKTLLTTKQTDDAVIKKILDDFWKILDSKLQNKRDRALAASPRPAATKPAARKTPKTS
jgi:hypothetical protein